MAADADPFPRCAVCGRPIRPGRRTGTWSHRAGAYASCDLDADHVVRPAEPERPRPPARDGDGR